MKFINITTTILGIIATLASFYIIFEQRNINVTTLILFVIGIILVVWKNKSLIGSLIKIIEKLK